MQSAGEQCLPSDQYSRVGSTPTQCSVDSGAERRQTATGTPVRAHVTGERTADGTPVHLYTPVRAHVTGERTADDN